MAFIIVIANLYYYFSWPYALVQYIIEFELNESNVVLGSA